MPFSNFPNGFANGVTVRGVPIHVAHPGKVFYVNNSSVLAPGQSVGGSNGNDGTYNRPFSTIDYAIGRCTAARGDIIYVMPGHAETVDAAGDIALDVSGVAVVGLGEGELRPILTFDGSDTTPTVTISAANTTWKNMVHKCNEASLATMIHVTATDVTIEDCEFRDGTQSGLGFVSIGTADNDADRCHVRRCKFYAPGANQDHAIEVLKDMIQMRFEDLEATGDYDEGCIALPAAANACLDLHIKRCVLRNTLTNVAAISINGTSCTGVIQDCLLVTDTQASALDNGSLATDNVRWADETDQVSATEVLAPVDSAANVLGADDADNAFASTNVASNRDGSVLERLEHLATLTAVGTVVPLVTTITSSAIPNNTQAAGGLLATVTGTMVLERVVLQTDATGLAGPTNIEISTDNTKGLTGAAAPSILVAVAELGANKTTVHQDAASETLPLYMTTGKKLYIHGDDAAGTGAGTVDVIMWFRRVSADASVA